METRLLPGRASGGENDEATPVSSIRRDDRRGGCHGVRAIAGDISESVGANSIRGTKSIGGAESRVPARHARALKRIAAVVERGASEREQGDDYRVSPRSPGRRDGDERQLRIRAGLLDDRAQGRRWDPGAALVLMRHDVGDRHPIHGQ